MCMHRGFALNLGEKSWKGTVFTTGFPKKDARFFKFKNIPVHIIYNGKYRLLNC